MPYCQPRATKISLTTTTPSSTIILTLDSCPGLALVEVSAFMVAVRRRTVTRQANIYNLEGGIIAPAPPSLHG